MSKHTRGPWAVRVKQPWERGDGGSFAIDAEEWGEMATVYAHCADESADIGQANARLIAAAPDLLHACRLIIENAPLAADWLERNDIGAYKQVKAAITKATGHD